MIMRQNFQLPNLNDFFPFSLSEIEFSGECVLPDNTKYVCYTAGINE